MQILPIRINGAGAKQKRRFIPVDAEMLERKARTPVSAQKAPTLTAKISELILERQCQRMEKLEGNWRP